MVQRFLVSSCLSFRNTHIQPKKCWLCSPFIISLRYNKDTRSTQQGIHASLYPAACQLDRTPERPVEERGTIQAQSKIWEINQVLQKELFPNLDSILYTLHFSDRHLRRD